MFLSYSPLSEEFWWVQEAVGGNGKEEKFWKVVQCPRSLMLFILGLCTAEGLWGCGEGARRTRGDWIYPENNLHQVLNCAFSLPPFYLPSRSSEPIAKTSASLSGTNVRGPLGPSALCLPQCSQMSSQPRQSCWGSAVGHRPPTLLGLLRTGFCF